MLTTSGFGCDWVNNMVMVDSAEIWENYVKTHPSVKHYRDKVIINWAKLGLLCGNDRASRSMAVIAQETLLEFEEESVGIENIIPAETSTTEGSRQMKRKSTPTDVIVDGIHDMSSTMKMTVKAITKPPEVTNADRVYETLAKLPDLDKSELCKALDLLTGSVAKYLRLWLFQNA